MHVTDAYGVHLTLEWMDGESRCFLFYFMTNRISIVINIMNGVGAVWQAGRVQCDTIHSSREHKGTQAQFTFSLSFFLQEINGQVKMVP